VVNKEEAKNLYKVLDAMTINERIEFFHRVQENAELILKSSITS